MNPSNGALLAENAALRVLLRGVENLLNELSEVNVHAAETIGKSKLLPRIEKAISGFVEGVSPEDIPPVEVLLQAMAEAEQSRRGLDPNLMVSACVMAKKLFPHGWARAEELARKTSNQVRHVGRLN